MSTEIVFNTDNHRVFTKTTPNAFSSKDFNDYMAASDIERLVIVGFNMEFCCLFTSIIASHEGYDVTLIEDACGTINDADTYEMPGLDIYDFIGTVLNWSDCVNVLYLEEYLDMDGQHHRFTAR